MTWRQRDLYFRWLLRHPAFRIFVAVFITILNFLIYAEDPVADSQGNAILPMIGRASSLLFTQWPSDIPGLMAAKIACALAAVLLGPLVGRQIIHRKLLRPRYQMFSEDKGTFMVMFFTTLVSLFFWSLIYSGIAGAALSSQADKDKYVLNDFLGIRNQTFMRGAATGTWLGDSVTAFMVLDMILQDKHQYLPWGAKARVLWREGYGGRFRIYAFWGGMITLTAIVTSVIFSGAVKWDEVNGEWEFRTTELGRGVLAGCITALDLTIVMQDWEFPVFDTVEDIKLPGVDFENIDVQVCQRCRPQPVGRDAADEANASLRASGSEADTREALAELERRKRRDERQKFFHIKITGKWFNYGIIFLVMCLDFNMLKNQVVYVPVDYAQYVDDKGFIWSIHNRTIIDRNDPTEMSYEARKAAGQVGDVRLNTRWVNWSVPVKALSLIPVAVGFGVFFYLMRKERREHAVAERLETGWAANRAAKKLKLQLSKKRGAAAGGASGAALAGLVAGTSGGVAVGGAATGQRDVPEGGLLAAAIVASEETASEAKGSAEEV